MKKRIVPLLLTLALGLSLLTAPAAAAPEAFVIEDGVLKEYNGPGGDVVIPEGVTAIGAHVFDERMDLKSVTLPDGLEEIGDFAFYFCLELEDVDIPKTVTRFGEHIFTETPWQKAQGTFVIVNDVLLAYNGGDVEHLTIPDGIRQLGPYSLEGIEDLQSVKIPDSVEAIGPGAFASCYDLEQVDFPDTLTDIDSTAFSYTSWLQNQEGPVVVNGTLVKAKRSHPGGDVILPETVRRIASGALFENISIPGLCIPGSVKVLETGVCKGHSRLRVLVLEEGVERICSGAFDIPSLCTVYLPASVTEIAPDAFRWKGITFHGSAGSAAEALVKAQGGVFIPCPPGTAPTGFSDIGPRAYTALPVLWAADQGITRGTSETTFSPDRPCTQGEVLTFLWHCAGSPADREAFTARIGAQAFSPKSPCTRAQAMTFLWRYDRSWTYEPEEIQHPFSDVPAASPYAEAVWWAVDTGVTTGTSETTFSPDRPCTRGEVLTFLYRNQTAYTVAEEIVRP